MKRFKDETLIKKIINKQCSKSLQELVDRHCGMIFGIGKKYCNSCSLDISELNDNRYWIVFNAAKSFNQTKGSKFSTWLGNQIRFFCLNYKNKNSKLIPIENKQFFRVDGAGSARIPTLADYAKSHIRSTKKQVFSTLF